MKTSILWPAVAVLILLALPSFGQIDKNASAKTPRSTLSNTSAGSAAAGSNAASVGMLNEMGSLTGIEGEIYIGKDWPQGELLLRNGKMINSYRYRYDIYSDQMQFTDGRDTLAFASPTELMQVNFAGRVFVYEPYECGGRLTKGYFEQLVQGKNRLLLKRSVTYHIDENQPSAKNEDKYFVSECYFLKKPGEPAVKMMCTRKSAMSVLDSHRTEMDAYMKKTGNKVKTREDLVKMVEYYNSLQ